MNAEHSPGTLYQGFDLLQLQLAALVYSSGQL
jgi:hypothetical protein